MTFEKILTLLAIIAGALLAIAGSYLVGNYFEQQINNQMPIGHLVVSFGILCIGAAVFTAALMEISKWSTTA